MLTGWDEKGNRLFLRNAMERGFTATQFLGVRERLNNPKLTGMEGSDIF